jgi:4-hydroxythreonine-4-phosphate dehydrogenase
MILVTQGHEHGVGLEVFLKSLLRLPKNICNEIILYTFKETLIENLRILNWTYEIDTHHLIFFGKQIKIIEPTSNELPQSTSSLLAAIKDIDGEKDVLLTLPTSKDQLICNGVKRAGYTEFFRSFFEESNISMIFKGIEGFTLLLTDHIQLKDVPTSINRELVCEKFRTVIEGLTKYFNPPKEFIIAGINPHAGEGGLLGNEEENLMAGLKNARLEHPQITFQGPLPGDTLHFEANNRENKVFVYTYHDQGLATFKDKNGLLGINISLGLPFLRLSVDHGTAFHIYGKNKADSSGCLFTLQEAYRVISNDYK